MNNLECLWQRVQGYFIDRCSLITGDIVLFSILKIELPYNLPVPSFLAENIQRQGIIGIFNRMIFGYPCIEVMIYLALYIVIAAHFFGATYGMNRLGLSIEDSKTGSKPSIIKILFWYLLAHISVIIFGIGYLWALVDKKGRTLHDIIAGVKVVSMKAQASDVSEFERKRIS